MQILYVWATSFSVPCITKTLRQYCLFLDWAGSTSSLVDFDWSGNGPSSGKHRNLGRAHWILSFSPPLQWNISILTVKKLNVVVKVIFDNVRAVFSFKLSPAIVLIPFPVKSVLLGTLCPAALTTTNLTYSIISVFFQSFSLVAKLTTLFDWRSAPTSASGPGSRV